MVVRRASLKITAALASALVLLAITLLTQAAPPSTEPAPTDLVWVSVLASADADPSHLFVGPVYRRGIGDLQRIAGHVRRCNMDRLANQPGVIHLPSSDPLPVPPQPDPAHFDEPLLDADLRGRERVQAIIERASEKPIEPVDGSPAAPDSWYENDVQGVHETWNTLGLTGTGVTIAVLDSGVDFANPSLNGQYAIQPSTVSGTQAYAGWPIAFDERSLSDYLSEPNRSWASGNWGWYVNGNHDITGSGAFTFTDPMSSTSVYTAPGTSQSGTYHLGYHPDSALDGALMLIADENTSGVYDAVYMDLDYDGTFETSITQSNPVGALDLTGDGVPDISAGMVYWIADGTNPPPGAEAVYGPGTPIPNAGTLVAFMIDDMALRGGGHGTLCSSTAVGYDGDGVFTPTAQVASFYNAGTYGPLVQGPAPGAKVIAVGNIYAGGSMDAWYLFTIFGYDGEPGTGDEPQIVTLSFGSSAIDNDVWDWESRYLPYLNLTYAEDSPLFITGAGNGGYGYGTLTPPVADTALIVGASTQFGTYNAWGISETVSLPARVNTGDVTSFSARGPGADGTRAVDVVASGIIGTGAYPLNSSYVPDGTHGYVHWRGTSRSAPVVGGMAALVAQGYNQANGSFPTYDELRLMMINGADDLGYDPLVQGAGQANALHSSKLALGQSGIKVNPPAAVAGGFRGQRYPSFGKGLARGETENLTFTVTNPSLIPAALDLDTQQLVEIARYTRTIQTITDTVANYGSGAPDYALNLTDWVTAHPGADLMMVRMQVPFEHFNELPPNPPTVNNRWRLLAYNWWDDNDDGTWWDDIDSDGRVDWPDELDGGDEWMRFDYCFTWGYGPQQEVRVGQPYTRSLGAGSAGIWAGAAHLDTGNPPTTLTFEVTFYQHADWPEVTLSTDSLFVPPLGQTTFQATVQVPSDAPHGLHQGTIVVAPSGSSHQTLVPLTYQVWPDGSGLDQTGITLGGAPRAGTPYDNGYLGGGITWGSGGESGDWRFYGVDLQDPPEGSVILVHNVWEEYPTDIDTLVLGPNLDGFSEGNPQWFGPYSLDFVGGSTRAGSRPTWEFDTATGDTEEWTSAPAQDGLHVLVHHAVVFGGDQAQVPFTTSVGLAVVEPYPLRFDPAMGTSPAITATFRFGLDITDGITLSYGFGWFTPTIQSTPLITEGGTIVHDILLADAPYRLDAALRNVTGADDLDLYLYDDDGSVAGAWDAGDELLEHETGPGVDKTLQARGLTAGQYWVLVEGQSVDAGGGSYDLEVLTPTWDSYGAMDASGLPAQVAAGETYTFAVQATRAFTYGQQGLLVLGPPIVPTVLEIPVFVEPLADVWVQKAGPAGAQPGETFAYTITYGNNGPAEAYGVWLTDTLPVSVTTTAPTVVGPLTLPVGSSYTWNLTATLSADMARKIALTNSVTIAATTPDYVLYNNAAEAVLTTEPYQIFLPAMFRRD
jgi:uncharacterized repeat protein (TIGR01451 family)